MDKKMLKQKKTGQIIVISAQSGAGKGTVIGKLLERDNKSRWLSVSATSRKPREGEKEGVNYYYLTEDDFKEKIDDNFFLEYTNYAGNYYGTPKKYIKEKIDQGIDVILEIDIEGARKVNEKRKDAVFIFIMPPSMKILKDRLVARKTETKEQLVERFKTAYKEINEVSKYNYVVVNDDLEDSIDKVNAIITCEKCRVDRIEDVDLGNREELIHELLIDFNQN